VIKNERNLSEAQQVAVTKYFDEQVRTQVVPLMIESIPQMPLLSDKAIYLACVLGSTAAPMLQRFALIGIPTRVLDRFFILPSEDGVRAIILLEDVIRFNLPHLFAPFGYDRFLSAIIKVTRDAELELDELQGDLALEMEKGLKKRKRGRATRFVYDRAIDPALLDYLTKRLELSRRDPLIAGGRIHNFKDFMNFPSSVFKDTKPRPRPFVHPLLVQPCRIMEVLDRRDVMLHMPYHSYDSVIDLLREAAIDPFVQSIKITSYRLAKNSKIVNALINAVRNGKQVTVVMELRARFDEEANLGWKMQLEEEGARVVLGPPNMKVHAKLCVIRKREFNRTKMYGFVSTGNFNESTARFYTDHLLMTSNRDILNDANKIFAFLETPQRRVETLQECTTLAVSPVSMRPFFMNMLAHEIRAARKGKKAEVTLKMNTLADKDFIFKLYEAARAGVKVNMIVRGACCAYTEQESFEGRMQAVSIVDEYLEHARVFVFHNGGEPKVFITSADWMVRNLDHRVEAATPIFDPLIQEELKEILKIQLAENVKGRVLDNKMTNRYVDRAPDEKEVRSQVAIYEYLRAKTYDA
jgi:polyphosphate kinase